MAVAITMFRRVRVLWTADQLGTLIAQKGIARENMSAVKATKVICRPEKSNTSNHYTYNHNKCFSYPSQEINQAEIACGTMLKRDI